MTVKLGRPTATEARRRERHVLQLVAAGHGWHDAAQQAGATPAATLRLLDRLGVGLPAHVQLEGP